MGNGAVVSSTNTRLTGHQTTHSPGPQTDFSQLRLPRANSQIFSGAASAAALAMTGPRQVATSKTALGLVGVAVIGGLAAPKVTAGAVGVGAAACALLYALSKTPLKIL